MIVVNLHDKSLNNLLIYKYKIIIPMKANFKISIFCAFCLIINVMQIKSQVIDFGDAIDPPYSTLIINNGARHNINPLIKLGMYIDAENDGQPALFSEGDDFTLSDDDDGVVFSGWLLPGNTYNLVVYASVSGLFLSAWIDFQANGNWTDPGDKICNNVFLNQGANLISFSIPSNAAVNVYTYARFRCSLMQNLSYDGFANEGEVEDYCVYLGVPLPGNIIIKPDPATSFCQNEISLALVPVHNTIVAAFNDNPFPGLFGLGIASSQDDGQTWTAGNLQFPLNPFSGVSMLDAFDPSVTTDNLGNVFVAHISTDNNWASGPVSGLFVHKSVSGGMTWMPPVTVSVDNTASGMGDPAYRFNDRCQIRCDKHSASPYQNHLYTSWIKDRGWYMPLPYSDVYFSRSTDGGSSFSAHVIVNDAGSNMANMPILDVSSDGDIYYLWVDYNVISGGQGKLFLDKSSDGGLTWGTDILVDSILLPPLYLNGLSDVRAKGAAVLRTHPTIPDKLYIVYAAFANAALNDESDIYLISSSDGGINWTQPLRVNDDLTNTDQVLPWMELKSDGTIDIAWYDRRNDPADLMWDVYFSTSNDGGQTFSQNTRISSVSFQTPRTIQGFWFGEYLGLVTNNQKTYIAFTSSFVDPMGDIFFSRINNPITNIEVDNNSFDAKIYPNPVNDFLNVVLIDFCIDKSMTLEIFSVSGQLLQKFNDNQSNFQSIDLSGYPQGIYLLKIFHGNSSRIEKVIKINNF
jgi:hypothetical protein